MILRFVSSQVKLQRKLCAKAFDSLMEGNRAAVVTQCANLGASEEQAQLLIDAMRELVRALPIAMDAMEDLSGILEELQGILEGPRSGSTHDDRICPCCLGLVHKPYRSLWGTGE